MTIRTAIFGLALFFVTGCTDGTNKEATGFITSQTRVEKVADAGDDVARDSYGRPYQYAFLDQALPTFIAPLHGGGTFDSKTINTWTVVSVWGIWCGDCRRDGPYTAKLANELAKIEEIDFIALHTPASKTRIGEAYGSFRDIQSYFDAQGYNFPTAIDLDASIRNKLSIKWTPTYLLVDPNGIVKGFRSELAVSGKKPVKRFIRDIQRVMKDKKAGQ